MSPQESVCGPAYDGVMSASEEVRESIQNQLQAIDSEVAALRDALKALDVDGAAPSRITRRVAEAATIATATTAKSVPRSERKPARRRQRGKPKQATEVVPAEELKQLLGASAGLSTTALATRGNAERDQVLTWLRELEAAGKARRTGERRGTRWHLVSDEDRIAERAAELERRNKAKSVGAKV